MVTSGAASLELDLYEIEPDNKIPGKWEEHPILSEEDRERGGPSS